MVKGKYIGDAEMLRRIDALDARIGESIRTVEAMIEISDAKKAIIVNAQDQLKMLAESKG